MLVASLGGSAEVRNAPGVLVARILPGAALVELRGSELKNLVGKHVHVVGSESGEAAAAGIPQTVSATPAGAGTAGASVPTLAVIGGTVAAGGTPSGLAATGVIGAGSSVSR